MKALKEQVSDYLNIAFYEGQERRAVEKAVLNITELTREWKAITKANRHTISIETKINAKLNKMDT